MDVSESVFDAVELGLLNELEREILDMMHESNEETLVLLDEYLERLVELLREVVEAESPIVPTNVIQNLPLVTLTLEQIQKENTCSVCLDEFSADVMVKLLPCSHYFHENCILPWLNIRNNCPICRYEFPAESS